MTATTALPPGIAFRGPAPPHAQAILTRAALDFVAFLERGFRARRAEILGLRAARQAAFDRGAIPDFAPETAWIRADDSWRVAPLPPDLRDRRIWITVPPTGQAFKAACEAGAVGVMADFEDGCAPTRAQLIGGQFNLLETNRRQYGPDVASHDPPALIVRPRGWHLDDMHMRIDGQPCAGAVLDFGLYLFHNTPVLIERGSGPYFCLPKIESRQEARLWNDILRLSEDRLALAPGTIRVACMVETLPAAFEMDEFLHELRDHATGLVAGHRDYALSTLRVLRHRRGAGDVAGLPDARTCQAQLVATCRRRGAFAMGTAADRIPIESDSAANEALSDRVRRHAADVARAGFDATRVMHAGMAAVAKAGFGQPAAANHAASAHFASPEETRGLPAPATAPVPDSAALGEAVASGVSYVGAWLAGNGSVAIHNRVADTASAELCVAHIRHWLANASAGAANDDTITPERVSALIAESLAALRAELGEPEWQAGRYAEGARLFAALCLGPDGDARLATAGALLLD